MGRRQGPHVLLDPCFPAQTPYPRLRLGGGVGHLKETLIMAIWILRPSRSMGVAVKSSLWL